MIRALKVWRYFGGMFAGLLFTVAAPAQTIIWTSARGIACENDVSTLGTLVAAYNFGPKGVSAVTVNSVPFAGFGIPDDSGTTTATQGTFTITESDGVLLANSDGASGAAPFSTLAPSYKTLLTTYPYASAPPTITRTNRRRAIR